MTATVAVPLRMGATRVQLRAEWMAFFVLFPVVVAIFLPPGMLFGALGLGMVLSMVLLARTPGFVWEEITHGWWRVSPVALLVSVLLTVVVCGAIVAVVAPDRLFALPMERPGQMAAMAVLYPLLSALPQEVVYRALFFRRYGDVLPAGRWALLLNGAVFAWAHVMYWNIWVVALTLPAGVVFAWAYVERRSFPFAWLLHAVCGLALFAAGLGVWFYSGNVVRPF